MGLPDIETIGNLEVNNVKWSANEARVLTATHQVDFEDASILPTGTFIRWTDPDLGTKFAGYIFSIKKTIAPNGSRQVVYQAADLFRLLAKQPARILCARCSYFNLLSGPPGTTHCFIKRGTLLKDAINLVLESVMTPGFKFFNSINVAYPSSSDIINTLPADMNKGGQTMQTWLNDICDQFEGAIAMIKYVSNGFMLEISDYYNKPAVMLTLSKKFGNTSDKNVPSATNPLVIDAEITETTNNKYRKVTVEGSGKYVRHLRELSFYSEQVFQYPPIPAPGSTPEDNLWVYYYRWYFPESVCNPVGYHIALDTDGNEVCGDACYMDFKYEYPLNLSPGVQDPDNWGPFEVKDQSVYPAADISDTDFVSGAPGNTRKGRWYIQQALLFAYEAPVDGYPPNVRNIEIKLTWTDYIGAYAVSLPTNPPASLNREGEFVIQRKDFFTYTSSEKRSYNSPHPIQEPAKTLDTGAGIDATETTPAVPSIQDTAKAYLKRYCGKPNLTGTIKVVIKGNTGNIDIGTKFPQFSFNGEPVRARSISISPKDRVMEIEVSDVPLREVFDQKKDFRIQKTEVKRNWRDRVVITGPECFPEITLDQDCHAIGLSHSPPQSGTTPP